MFDDSKQELKLSLDTILMKEEILTKNFILYYNSLPFGGIDIDKICIIKVDNEEEVDIIRSMYNIEFSCNDKKIDEFIPILVKDIERRENKSIINIENIYDINNFNYLIVEKKHQQLLTDNDILICESKNTMILTE